MINRYTQKSLWLLVIALVITIDQITKYYAVSYLSPYDSYQIGSMLSFTLAYNTGAAFSFLVNTGLWHHWFLAIFSATVSLILIILLIRMPSDDKLQAAAISCIVGGALGNLYDRLFLGYVIDFIDVYYRNHHWPIFNLADSFICIGAFLLLCKKNWNHNSIKL